MRKWLISILVLFATTFFAGLGFFYLGLYPMGADAPHWPLTEKVIGMVRDRAIARQAQQVQVPKLDDAELVLKGAAQYDAMCAHCHLAPGRSDSDIRPGLYPQPPKLAEHQMDPKVTFWVTKHGIKMSGMPAWGINHDDATLWAVVAFVNKLPGMSPAQYAEMVAKAQGEGHTHGSTPHGHGNDTAAPGMANHGGSPSSDHSHDQQVPKTQPAHQH